VTTDTSAVCGIIMPISAIDDKYSEDHWSRVKLVLENAITDAGMVPQPVWENQANDVIQARILKNLYENELVVCDVSGRNANVMLELGMRLSTRKPTILVADGETPLPFDTSVIAHSFYQKDLEYNATKKFVADLTETIVSLRRDVAQKKYVSFVENFRFETVTPSTIAVPAEEFFAEKIEEISRTVLRLENSMRHEFTVLEARDGYLAASDRSRHPQQDTLDFINQHITRELNVRTIFEIGDRVFHAKFGHGTVTKIDGNKIDAKFDETGDKRVMSSFLRASDTPP
jgi:hypothetical protein